LTTAKVMQDARLTYNKRFSCPRDVGNQAGAR
jgi:hypothetical protein